jgi:ribosomal protein S27AE
MAKNEICSNCGYTGSAKKVTKGSTLIELVLWLCFIIPGLIYSIWRLSSKHLACPQCGASHLVPLESPRGKKLQQEFSQ